MLGVRWGVLGVAYRSLGFYGCRQRLRVTTMDPGLRRDDGWGVSRYKGTLQRDTHFVITAKRMPTCTKRYKGTLTLFTPSGKCSLSTPIRQRYTTMDPGLRRDDDLRVCSQPSLPLFQPTVKTENPVARHSVILTKVRIQRLSSFFDYPSQWTKSLRDPSLHQHNSQNPAFLKTPPP